MYCLKYGNTNYNYLYLNNCFLHDVKIQVTTFKSLLRGIKMTIKLRPLNPWGLHYIAIKNLKMDRYQNFEDIKLIQAKKLTKPDDLPGANQSQLSIIISRKEEKCGLNVQE